MGDEFIAAALRIFKLYCTFLKQMQICDNKFRRSYKIILTGVALISSLSLALYDEKIPHIVVWVMGN